MRDPCKIYSVSRDSQRRIEVIEIRVNNVKSSIFPRSSISVARSIIIGDETFG